MVKFKSYSPFRSAPWCFRDLRQHGPDLLQHALPGRGVRPLLLHLAQDRELLAEELPQLLQRLRVLQALRDLAAERRGASCALQRQGERRFEVTSWSALCTTTLCTPHTHFSLSCLRLERVPHVKTQNPNGLPGPVRVTAGSADASCATRGLRWSRAFMPSTLCVICGPERTFHGHASTTLHSRVHNATRDISR